MSICVVFPAFNEEANVEETIQRSLTALREFFEDFEIIIIDDASTDRTGQLADRLAAIHPEIKVVHNAANIGQGASILKGFALATRDLVLHNALDYPFDLRHLPKMMRLLDRADIVVAVRRQRAGYSLYRKILSRTNLLLLRVLFGLNLRDYNFVQLYKRPVLTAVHVDARSPAFVTPELLIRAHDLGFRIVEVDIEYLPRRAGVATAGHWRVVARSLRDMLGFWRRRTRQRSSPSSPKEHRAVPAAGGRDDSAQAH